MADSEDTELQDDDLEQEGARSSLSMGDGGDSEAERKDAEDKQEAFVEVAGLLKKYNPVNKAYTRDDVLNSRFEIQVLREIQEFSNDFATAYEVKDETSSNQECYALRLDRTMPYRMKNIEAQLRMEHPNLLQLMAYGPVHYSDSDTINMTVVFEKPAGKPLREVLESKRHSLTERHIIEHIIAPISQILRSFQTAGISHGNINLDSVFLGESIQLGDCVSQPCGYAQHFHFESAERYQANPMGKGDSGTAMDCYALGILVAHIVLGARFFERVDVDSFINRRLVLGTYNILLGGREYSSLDDFFKGVLNDDPFERWTPEHIAQWVAGKKFNLLTPSVLREGQRPYPFNGEDYFNRRALANSFAQNWDDAQANLRTGHLSRWVEVSLHKNEMAEQLRKVMERTGGIHAGSERANNELVARSIMLLDPEGPMRYGRLSSYADGLGCILANAFRKMDQATMHHLAEIITYNFYALPKNAPTDRISKRALNVIAKLPACIQHLRTPAMGFGMERVLYELNPNLPCQSPLLAHEDVLTGEDMLNALDRLGKRQSQGFEYLDRHIAAFVATRIELQKEIKLADLRIISALSQNPQLIILFMLAQVQRKAGKPKLRGLTSWAVLRVIPLVDNFHSRSIRRKVRDNLKNAAKSGEIDRIFEALNDAAAVHEDTTGFQKAVHRYGKNVIQIDKLLDKEKLAVKSERIGMVLATIVGYSILLLTAAVVLKDAYF
ncbi:MAG: hypothetical protein FJX23_04015 [Alphaproteobacteria bacterium]|nr:hypothetical protein [Alphaproteobacteria bacterium]